MATNQPKSRQVQKQLKRKVYRKKVAIKRTWEFPFSRKNIYILGVGLVVILIGFALMATGITDDPAIPDGQWNNPFAVSIAPMLLVLGYCVIIPYGILKYYKADDNNKRKS